jgi:hypothetical protein
VVNGRAVYDINVNKMNHGAHWLVLCQQMKSDGLETLPGTITENVYCRQ